MFARIACLLGALALPLGSLAAASAKPATGAAAAENIAGSIDLVDGTVTIIDAAKRERPALKGDVVVEGDTIATAADAEAHLVMEDGGEIGLRQNTRILIHKYKAEGAADDRSVIGLVQGAMRSVTGWIGRYNSKNYQIRTATATVGVRGTDHETKVVLPGNPEAEPGTYEKVNAGATTLTTAAGTAEVPAHAAGFVARAGRERPRLLPAVPAHFRPARHEQRFEGLHDAIVKRVEQVRAERIKLIRENRPAFEKRRQELRQQRAERIREHLQRRRLDVGPRHDAKVLPREQRRAELEARRQAKAGERRAARADAAGEAQRKGFEENRKAREAQRQAIEEKRRERDLERNAGVTGPKDSAGSAGDDAKSGHRRLPRRD
jgi:hypothetical protein